MLGVTHVVNEVRAAGRQPLLRLDQRRGGAADHVGHRAQLSLALGDPRLGVFEFRKGGVLVDAVVNDQPMRQARDGVTVARVIHPHYRVGDALGG